AGVAGLFDFLAGAAAGRTDLGEGDDAAAAADLTGAAAGGTGDFLGTGFRAGAVAALAGDGTAEGDFPFGALGRFFERDFEVVAQIGAVAVGTAASTAATEKLLENATSAATTAAGVEDFAEDVEGIVESTAASAGAARTGAAGLLEGGVTVAVVGGPFLRVLEDFVGLGDFFEHLLGLLVTGVFVRVILDGLLAVGFFELVFGRAFLDAEQFVVIGLSHGLE